MSIPVSEPSVTSMLSTSSCDLVPSGTEHDLPDPPSRRTDSSGQWLHLSDPATIPLGMQLHLSNIESAIAALRHEVRSMQRPPPPGKVNHEKVDRASPLWEEPSHPSRLYRCPRNVPVVEDKIVSSKQPEVALEESPRVDLATFTGEQNTISELLQRVLRAQYEHAATTTEQLRPLQTFISNLSDWLVQERRERHDELRELKGHVEELRSQECRLREEERRREEEDGRYREEERRGWEEDVRRREEEDHHQLSRIRHSEPSSAPQMQGVPQMAGVRVQMPECEHHRGQLLSRSSSRHSGRSIHIHEGPPQIIVLPQTGFMAPQTESVQPPTGYTQPMEDDEDRSDFHSDSFVSEGTHRDRKPVRSGSLSTQLPRHRDDGPDLDSERLVRDRPRGVNPTGDGVYIPGRGSMHPTGVANVPHRVTSAPPAPPAPIAAPIIPPISADVRPIRMSSGLYQPGDPLLPGLQSGMQPPLQHMMPMHPQPPTVIVPSVTIPDQLQRHLHEQSEHAEATAEQLGRLTTFTNNLSNWLEQERRDRHHEFRGLNDRIDDLRHQISQVARLGAQGTLGMYGQ